MEKELLDWPIVLQYDVKAKYWLFSRKFSGMKFFHPSVRLTNKKPHAFDLFNKQITLLYFHSFVVSVLFAHFHFKVKWKSLYQVHCFNWMVSIQKKLHFQAWLNLYIRGIPPISWQAVFGLRQVTFLASLPKGKGMDKPPPVMGSRKLVKKKVILFCAVVPKMDKTFWAGYLKGV